MSYKNFKLINLLVSLKSLDEITDDVIKSVNIIDLKNPLKGSIGSWNLDDLKKAILLHKSKTIISATLGDIFDNKEFLSKLQKFDDLNLNFIKFGLLSNKNDCLFQKLKIISKNTYKTDLVCVVFVDQRDTLKQVFENLKLIKNLGINYLLLDTFKKFQGDLLTFCELSFLKNFISKCKDNNIKIGLAGSLKEFQIPSIINLKPNIIGFRSAICDNNKRNCSINSDRLKSISSYFNFCNSKAIAKAGA